MGGEEAFTVPSKTAKPPQHHRDPRGAEAFAPVGDGEPFVLQRKNYFAAIEPRSDILERYPFEDHNHSITAQLLVVGYLDEQGRLTVEVISWGKRGNVPAVLG